MNNRYPALSMAAYIVQRANELGITLDHLKLQKLIYFINLEWLKEFNTLAINEDTEKWKLGPVVREVYDEYKSNGSFAITKPSTQFILDDELNLISEPHEAPQFADRERRLVNEVIVNKGKETSWNLVEETHTHKPWKDYSLQINEGQKGLVYTPEEFRSIIEEVTV